MPSLLFKGGRLIDPASRVDTISDVLIEDGRVTATGKKLSRQGAEVIDIDGAVICPGFVDMHSHLREPGREDEETIASGSAAAAAGGYTAVCAMPNTDPVCDNAAIAETVAAEGARAALVQVIPAGAITEGLMGKRLSAIGEMARSPAGVRMFTDDGKGVADARLLRRAMEYIRGFGAVCAEHCEDANLAQSGQMHEGKTSELLGLKGVPSEAEEIPLGRDIALARLTGVRFHALHVSTAGSVALIRRAKAEGLRVTAEVTPHHLCLTDAQLTSYDPNFKVNPPLRPAADVQALRAALAEGVIDAIATDHAPHSLEEKEAEFEAAPPGMIGLETALGVMVSEIVGGQVLSLYELVRLMSTSPARLLGLDSQGGPIVEGVTANLTVFDPEARGIVDPGNFKSKSRNTPWAGIDLKGRILHTVFDGRRVFAHDELLAAAPVPA